MLTTSATIEGFTFLDAETAGGDELRALTAAQLAALLADCLYSAEAEKATWEARPKGRELRASMRLVDRAEAIACRLHEYLGYKLTELENHQPHGCSHRPVDNRFAAADDVRADVRRF